MHGQKVARIIKLRDQPQLFLDHAANLERHRIWIAADQPFFGQLTQTLIRLQPIADLIRVFIAQLIQREGTGLGDPGRIGHSLRIGLEQPSHLKL